MKINLLSSFLIGLLACVFVSCDLGTSGNVVNVYSHRHYPIDQELFSEFERETGIRVNVVSATADELITRLELEGERSPADLLITVDAGNLHKAKTAGLLQSVSSSTVEEVVPPRLRDSENYWFAYTYRARAIAYAPDRIDSATISTYEKLARSDLGNRLVMRSSENPYNQSLMASIVANLGSEQAAEWCRGLTGNFARNPRGNDRDQIKAVAAGQADVTVCNTYYVAKLGESPNAEEREVFNKIKVLFPNQHDRGTHINISGAGVTKHAPNKDNAVKLLEFLISAPVQERLSVENHEYPVRDDVELSPYLESWGEFLIDTLSLEKLGEFNAPAVRIMDECGWM